MPAYYYYVASFNYVKVRKVEIELEGRSPIVNVEKVKVKEILYGKRERERERELIFKANPRIDTACKRFTEFGRVLVGK